VEELGEGFVGIGDGLVIWVDLPNVSEIIGDRGTIKIKYFVLGGGSNN
jgi:hypothetical protein